MPLIIERVGATITFVLLHFEGHRTSPFVELAVFSEVHPIHQTSTSTTPGTI